MIRSCDRCGYDYGERRWGVGDAHNCGTTTISNDRLRELEAAERRLIAGTRGQANEEDE